MAIKPPPKKKSGGAPAGNVPGGPTPPSTGTGAAGSANPLQKPAPVAPAAKPAVFGSSGSPLRKPTGHQQPAPSVSTRVTISTGSPRPVASGARGPGFAPASEEMRIEERAFAIRSIRDAKPPVLLKGFVESIVPKILLPETTRAILEAFSNIDVNADKVAQIIQANPYYEHQFFKVIHSLNRRENVDRLESAIVLLGMQNSRNLIIALQAMRTVRGGHAEWTKEGKLKLQPNDVLRYALKTEEVLAGTKDSYADTAYAAGLCFDLLMLAADQVSPLPPVEKKRLFVYIDGIYLHGLRSAQVAAELARGIPDLGFRKYVFSACLIHDVGKIILAILEPSYLSFVDECMKKNITRNVRVFAETRRFGINHAILGALCCEYFQMFQSVGKAIQYHHEPFLLRGGKAGLGQLASLVSLASNVASNFKKTDKVDDPVIALWKGPELQTFAMDTRSMLQAVSRVV